MEIKNEEIIKLVLFRICNPKDRNVDFKSTTIKFEIANPEQHNMLEDALIQNLEY